ncbi:MAG: L-carnitine dehydratase/bile acid-inducible protein [candidate division NC10 bacterium]|jgi:crotonobetainyl-CoA:carnitine CoA-transferase CaiB-like acyl-CoA transferase|nr:L-carnitine dehydratase/bile acid-inducible protein [candidate division NC10 bacterium]
MESDAPLTILQGTRILSFTQFLLGPAGVQYLADLGADVIKVEAPGGTLFERNWAGCDLFLNGVSAFYLCANRNQRNLTLNLKHPDGQAAAKRLIAGADVLVQNFRPGVMERLGLAYEQVASLNPRLIYVSASGYGEKSIYKDRPGQDLLLQAMSGLASISGRAGHPPTAVGAPVVDQHGAALLAMGVLAAMLDRTRTGRGQKVEVTMIRSALDLQLEVLAYYLNGGQMRKSPTSLASMFHPGPYGIYETRDGYLALSMSPLPELQAALQLAELAPLATERFNHPAREEIARILEPVIRARTTREWVEYLVPRGIWAAPILDYEAVLEDPAVRESDVVEEVEHPTAGKVRLLRFPVEFSSGRASCRRIPPRSGEHTDEVLREIGYSEAEVQRFREGGVV